jgi:hypothetical protein
LDRPLTVDVLPSQLHEKVSKARGDVMAIAKSLGMWLRNREGRWAGPRTVRKAFTDRNGVVSWHVESAGSAGSGNPHSRGESEGQNSNNGHKGVVNVQGDRIYTPQTPHPQSGATSSTPAPSAARSTPRPGAVRTAPTLPGTSRVGLSSASPPCCDRNGGGGLSPPLETTAPHGARGGSRTRP